MTRPPKAALPNAGTARAEIMISAILPMLAGLSHIAVGASSPVPGTAALLTRALSKGKTRVSLLGSRRQNPFTDGGKELFDCAAQGRIDAFFLSGGQIDGRANINLMGLGPHDQPKVRFPGTFGSAYLYHIIPRVILFREEHTPRTLVKTVEFITAAGTSPAGEFRPGGPFALVTGLCVFSFDKGAGQFTLVSTHPGVTTADVRAATGFDYIEPPAVPGTPELSRDVRAVLVGEVAADIAETYPAFVAAHWPQHEG
jgi:glutaconate CoA-transferase, subunit B